VRDFELCSSASEARGIIGRVLPDVVINMANYFTRSSSYSDALKLAEVNCILVTEICQGVIESGGVLVNVGSGFQANLNRDDLAPDLYLLYKGLSTSIVEWFSTTQGLKAINLFLYDTYGRNDPRGKIVQLLIRANKENRLLDLSEGNQVLEMVYISDVAEAVSLLVSKNQELVNNAIPSSLKSYWCYPEEALTLRELVREFEAAANSKLGINWGARDYRPGERFTNEKKGRPRVPGWTPKVNLGEGLRLCLED
jgi:nucleoside-diphosphate-sugar epimerase